MVKDPKTFYGYKVDKSEPFELKVYLSLDYDVKKGQVIRIGDNGAGIAVADTPAETRGAFIISGAFYCYVKNGDVKVKVGDFLGCDVSDGSVVDLHAPNSLPLFQVLHIAHPKDGSWPILTLGFTQPAHP